MNATGQKAMEKELLGLEKEYWQAIKDNRPETMARLSEDPCVVTGAQGVGSLDHATMLRMAASGKWKLEDFELIKPIVRSIAPNVAVVAYQVREELDVEGRKVTLNAADSSTWVHRGGRWVCAAHTESVLGDPFGRDHQQ